MRIRKKYLVNIFVFAAVSLATAYYASSVLVSTYSAINAELIVFGGGFVIESKGITAAKNNVDATGTVEITNTLPNVNTQIQKRHWTYSVIVKEEEDDSVTSGTFTVELFIDDVSKGQISIKQDQSSTDNVEGVTCTWDIGESIPTEALYIVKVTPS